jgi:hypothetical protein
VFAYTVLDPAGSHTVAFNMGNANGFRLSQGVKGSPKLANKGLNRNRKILMKIEKF